MHKRYVPERPKLVIYIRLTGPDRLNDMTTLVESGTIVGGGQPGVFGVTSTRQLELLRGKNIAFEEVSRIEIPEAEAARESPSRRAR